MAHRDRVKTFWKGSVAAHCSIAALLAASLAACGVRIQQGRTATDISDADAADYGPLGITGKGKRLNGATNGDPNPNPGTKPTVPGVGQPISAAPGPVMSPAVKDLLGQPALSDAATQTFNTSETAEEFWGGREKAGNSTFYKGMPDWTRQEWYNKTFAKKVQAIVIDLPRKNAYLAPKDVEFMHPVPAVWEGGKVQQAQIDRRKLLQNHLEMGGTTELSIDLQQTVLRSAGGAIQVIRLPDGSLIAIDGNGRLFAIAGLPKELLKKLLVEVQVIDGTKLSAEEVKTIRNAQMARGAKGYDPNNPDQFNPVPPPTNMSDDQVIQGYYEAANKLNERREKAGR